MDHFRRVAENTSLPVFLYSNPGMTGGVKVGCGTPSLDWPRCRTSSA